jgi:hypothetical protein
LKTDATFMIGFVFILCAIGLQAFGLSLRRLNIHQTHIDVLSAASLTAMHGENILARLQRRPARRVERHLLIVGCVAADE